MLKILLKHTLYEITINKFFNTVESNFSTCRIPTDEVLQGIDMATCLPVKYCNNRKFLWKNKYWNETEFTSKDESLLRLIAAVNKITFKQMENNNDKN